ncbi:hypothetical protein ACPV5G_19945 [Photobacterium damselae]|uniref:hypothetical protein n=1 Tax=Photobacterium damselae TaxID=38293 RepID=UPI0040693E22
MLNKYKRTVSFLEMTIACHPLDGPIIEFKSDCLQILNQLYKENLTVYIFNDTNSIFRIAKLDIEDSILSILFQYSNKNASDPSFLNERTGQVRSADKLNEENLVQSIHMVIDLNSRKCNQKKITTNLILIEDISNIDRNLLKSSFTHFFRNIGNSYWEFKRKKMNGKDSIVGCRPIFTFHNLASDNLASLFRSKNISTINLIKKKTTGLGDSNISEEKTTISYKVSKKILNSTPQSLIEKIFKFSRDNGYSIIKFNYKDDNDKTIAATFSDTDSQRLATITAAYSKKDIIKTTTPIKQCEDDFHYELHNRMKNILLKEVNVNDCIIDETYTQTSELYENCS